MVLVVRPMEANRVLPMFGLIGRPATILLLPNVAEERTRRACRTLHHSRNAAPGLALAARYGNDVRLLLLLVLVMRRNLHC